MLAIADLLWYDTWARLCAWYAMMREVADRRVGEFPRSMSDLQTGRKRKAAQFNVQDAEKLRSSPG